MLFLVGVNKNKIHSAVTVSYDNITVLSGDFHFVCECCSQRASVGSDDTSAIVTLSKRQQQGGSFWLLKK